MAVERQPNVIWVFGDQHRAQACGFVGDPNVHTPHLDRLATEGSIFTGAVAGTPLCGPYRGSLLTSRYPHDCVPGHEYPLPDGQPTVADAFNDAGYRTAYFGKWHVDGWHERDGRAAMHIVPPERRGGFRDWLGYENNNSQWDSWVHGEAGDDAFHDRLPAYETDALTDLLLDWLRHRGDEAATDTDQPFFAVLSVQPPHDPYVAPAEWMARHTPGRIRLRSNVPDVPWVQERARRDLAGYYAMIENLDWNLGRIRTVLAETGLADETYLVFFSDHGDMHGSHGQFRKTAPWEEALRVPFVIGGTVHRYRGGTNLVPVPLNHVDVAPTTLGLCGIPPPEWMAGTDYSAYHRGTDAQTPEAESALLQLVVPTRHGDSVDRPWRGIVTGDGWKYVVLEGQPWLMFNLNDDPYEQVNLAHNTAFATERDALQDRLGEWMHRVGDRFAMPEI